MNESCDRPALTPELVLGGYRQGFFPMAEESGEIFWYSPDPRAILDLQTFHVPRTLRQVIRQGRFRVTINQSFDRVIHACSQRTPTWLSAQMIDVYRQLHRMGFAYSIETWQGPELAGGLYGVALGGGFFGESMFHTEADASKVALAGLVQQLRAQEFVLLDAQYLTSHLARFGAQTIPRDEYLERLERALALSRQLAPLGQTDIAMGPQADLSA